MGAEASSDAIDSKARRSGAPVRSLVVSIGTMILLAGCAGQPGRQVSMAGSKYDPYLGVSASPRVVADGEPVPRGGGSYLVGHPYTIAGRSYFPSERPQGYSVVGTASWYGDAFHGRRTANGEIFDKGSISAAHPTLPLPSYVRVTNLTNGRSMIVRVNDRGPYHGGRVMDVSQRVAESLDFRNAGTARIRVDYIGRASLGGSDDQKLASTLRTDGQMAQLDGFGSIDVASAAPSQVPAPARPQSTRLARLAFREEPAGDHPDDRYALTALARNMPVPPPRPFAMTEVSLSGRRGAPAAVPEPVRRTHVAADRLQTPDR